MLSPSRADASSTGFLVCLSGIKLDVNSVGKVVPVDLLSGPQPSSEAALRPVW